MGIVGLLVVRRVVGEPVGDVADEAASAGEAGAAEGEDETQTVPPAELDRKP
ncbi:hypothetical protein [Rubrobacter marinus]|uniref:hypothetical protein n=1 Tax=Rubrobacter marinus TaxID=2653852 RepID=UPI001D193CE3|nr:hypothetical protein [Rubrobacter marinus]